MDSIILMRASEDAGCNAELFSRLLRAVWWHACIPIPVMLCMAVSVYSCFDIPSIQEMKPDNYWNDVMAR